MGDRKEREEPMTGIGTQFPCLAIAAAIVLLPTLAVAAGDGRSRDGIAADVNGEAITRDELKEVVRDQAVQMETRLEDDDASAAVRSDIGLARRAGVTGTPMLFLNDRRERTSSQLESEVEALPAVPSQRGAEERNSTKRRRK